MGHPFQRQGGNSGTVLSRCSRLSILHEVHNDSITPKSCVVSLQFDFMGLTGEQLPS